jgi:hypothetical protein
MTIRDIDKMSEIEIILDNLFWLGFKLCMAGKLETAPNESLAEAEQAINAYILGEVMELLEDESKPDHPDDNAYSDDDLDALVRNQLRQELRNKANKKFGGK